MTAKVLMVQGTASHAGKSLMVAALCRIFRQDGYNVAPFKAQNMSLNSFVTPDGGEIGRAQAVQAEAACVPPTVEMNPVLLKPEADSRSQVVLMGKPHITVAAADYYDLKSHLWPHVTSSLDKLRSDYDIIVIEGAGSPAEINLSDREIVNMRVARYANAPVLLIGDIERGGVFASLIGTMELLESEECALIKSFVINKFRGDPSILEPGLRILEERTNVPVAGIIPWFDDIYIADEDSLGLENRHYRTSETRIDIAVIRFPYLANFDDFDPLENEPGVTLRYVNSVIQLGEPDLIILPGTKTTISDLSWLKQQGFPEKILEQYRQGSFIIGICGGYQMLGQKVLDPDRLESRVTEDKGLGLLPITTVFTEQKETHQVTGEVIDGIGLLAGAKGAPIEGYEIHMGLSNGKPDLVPFGLSRRDLENSSHQEGALDAKGRVLGTYVHGLFQSTALRRTILHNIANAKGKPTPIESSETIKDSEYDKLAELVRNSLDMDLIYRITGLVRTQEKY